MTTLAVAADFPWEEAGGGEDTAEPSAPQRQNGQRGGRRSPGVLRLLGGEAAAELAGRVSTGRELAEREAERRRDAFPTGLPHLDRLLDGGLPRGELVELVGRSGSGRFAAALTVLATATRAGEAAVLVDLGDHLTPATAARLGIDLERLLWLRPETTGDALAAAETALNGGFPLVVLDLGTPPVAGGRGNEASWVRLTRAAETHGAALLVASPYRVSGTAAHSVVTAQRGRAVYAGATPGAKTSAGRRGAPPLLAGLGTRWVLEKTRGRRAGGEEAVQLALPGTFPPPPPAPAGAQPASHRAPAEGAAARPGRRPPKRSRPAPPAIPLAPVSPRAATPGPAAAAAPA